jgi:hypothetical protein
MTMGCSGLETGMVLPKEDSALAAGTGADSKANTKPRIDVVKASRRLIPLPLALLIVA